MLGIALSSNAFLEAQWILFSLLFLLGAPAGLCRGDHVRVDILLSRLAPHVQGRIAWAGHILLLLPFSLILAYLSLAMVEASWQVAEQSPDPGGLPRYPVKTIIPLAFFMLFLQTISEIIKEARKSKASGIRQRPDGQP
jgi:TRAP-type mannitol/chloroaromatic compound transport system permease small subunit